MPLGMITTCTYGKPMSTRAADGISSLRIAKVAVLVQLAKLLLALLAGILLRDYDASTSLIAGLCNQKDGQIFKLHGIPAASLVWDSMFFARIACQGYQQEQQYAFFPLLPALLRLFKADINAIAAIGLCISSATAAASAVLFSTLTMSVLQDSKFAAMSTLLFIFNPASIFHTAVYTESLFGFLTLLGLNALYLKQPPTSFGSGSSCMLTHAQLWTASACFMLSSATRSNGIVNAGFIMHATIQASIHQLNALRHPEARKPMHEKVWVLFNTALILTSGALSSIAIFCPIILHQLHAHAMFCQSVPASASNPAVGNSTTAAVLRKVMAVLWQPNLDSMYRVGMQNSTLAEDHWCRVKPAWKPAIYGYIQSKYWGVGLLQYWQVSQIPNFLLAAPVLLLSLLCIITYTTHRWQHLLRGGFAWNTAAFDNRPAQERKKHTLKDGHSGTQPENVGEQMSETAMGKSYSLRPRKRKLDSEGRRGIQSHEMETLQQQASASSANLNCEAGFRNNPDVAVFVYPLAFQAACALLVMHVQVATRFLSTSPALFWYMAHLLQQCGQAGPRNRSAVKAPGYWKVTSIWMWCWSYMLIGTVLFINFYPWT